MEHAPMSFGSINRLRGFVEECCSRSGTTTTQHASVCFRWAMDTEAIGERLDNTILAPTRMAAGVLGVVGRSCPA